MNNLSIFRTALLAALTIASPRLTLAQSTGAEQAKPVPVRDEPHHKVTMENAYLRMIDVHFPPGAVTLYHIHTIPSVVVELADADIASQEWGAAPPAPRHVAPGETRYASYDEKPLTHRVTNTGKTLFHVLDIELLRPPASVDLTPPNHPAELKLEWEQKLARLYQFPLAAGKQTEVKANKCAHLLIGISGMVQASAPNAQQELKAGAYLYFAPGTPVKIDNRGKDAAACILLELK